MRLALEPTDALIRRAATTYLHLGHFDFAAVDYARLIGEHPELKGDAQFCRQLGNTLAELGQGPVAVASLKSAFDSDPHNLAACYELALAARSLPDAAARRRSFAGCAGTIPAPERSRGRREVVWRAALNPDVAGDAARWIEMARFAASHEPDSYRMLRMLALGNTGPATRRPPWQLSSAPRRCTEVAAPRSTGSSSHLHMPVSARPRRHTPGSTRPFRRLTMPGRSSAAGGDDVLFTWKTRLELQSLRRARRSRTSARRPVRTETPHTDRRREPEEGAANS